MRSTMMPSLRGALLVLLGTTAHLASAWPTVSPHVTVVRRAEDVSEEYDYVIVGGGTSGLTVADRITEDGKYTVLVIENGQFWDETGFDLPRVYNILSEPSPALNNRSFFVGIGNGVGGSSLVFGQVYLRGTEDEYAGWAQLSGKKHSTWNWKGLLPYFKKALTLNPPTPEQVEAGNIKFDQSYWGEDTGLYATFGGGPVTKWQQSHYSAMSKVDGMETPEDSASGKAGLYWYPLAQDSNYVRSYARTGHWDGISRDNYQMIVGSKVSTVQFDEDLTATGVVFTTGNSTEARTVKAKREVILAAGAIHTPQVLMLSGIGPKAHLEAVGIDVKVDAPGVGSNFQDHSYIPSLEYSFANPPSDVTPIPGPGYGPDGAPNLAAMMGLPVITPKKYKDIAKRYSQQNPADFLPAEYTPELIEGYRHQQKFYTSLMKSKNVVFNEVMLTGPSAGVQNLHPVSRGTVRLNPADPHAEPIVDYRAGSNPIDLEVMVETVKFLRRYYTEGELAQYGVTETLPGPDVVTDADVDAWCREQITPSVFHPVGTTAKMPRKWGGVVDEDLFVYGTKNLRIIDAGIQPTLIGATTCQTVYAVAEKIAEVILDQAVNPPKCKVKRDGPSQ
ncbi:related to alcohol oxidase [Cephalotrichum gorgonifer]|uniref:Related to alcohol oxidase n=1 Tax=Cephalotrichum gorgonifer TaxID=2041049 RepID=A0AAE8STN3_9PEZI|nr:related to alcohol oxidase [Cephalotrichum gorgonifer]